VQTAAPWTRSKAKEDSRIVIGRRLAVSVAILAAWLLVSAALPVSPSAATPLAQKAAAAKAKVAKVKAELESLRTTLEATIQQYDLANLKLAAAQKGVEQATYKLQVARFRLSVAQERFTKRMVAIYEQPPLDVLDVVFSARSFTDMTTELQGLSEISASDSHLVGTLHHAEAAVAQKRASLVVARAQARTYLTAVATKKADIESAVAQQQHIFATAKAVVRRIQKEEAAAAARAAAAAMGTVWRNPRAIPPGPWGNGHPEVIAIARKYLGIPYVYAAADPSVGFDCSGLVMYCYAQIGIQLPHYSGFQQNMGTPVPMNALIPGDLVFMGYPVSYHVALYAGNGQVIQAPYTGAVVSYGSLGGFQYAVRLP